MFNQLKVNNTANRSYLLRLYEEILKKIILLEKQEQQQQQFVKSLKRVELQFSSDKGEIERLPNSSGYKSPGTQPNEQLSKL